MADVLPPELTDEIIDHIHDDLTTLRACSLTCKAWAVSAQGHIFHTVRLFFDRAGLEAFVKLESSPRLAQNIRVLGIKGSGDLLSATEYRFVENIFPLFAPKLVKLERLEISHIRFHRLDASTQLAIIQMFPPLRKLIVTSCAFEDFYGIASFFISQPYVQHLDLCALSWKHGQAVYPAASPPRHLHTLISSYVGYFGLFTDWIISIHPPPPLHTLRIPTSYASDTPAISRLLEALGPSLEHLELGVPYWNSLIESEKSAAPSISKNTSLRSLCTASRKILSQFTWMLSFLAQVKVTSLEEIALQVWFEAEDLEHPEWEKVDDVLNREHFSGLCKVVVRLYGIQDHTEGRREIKRRMKGVSERGLLVLIFQ